MWYCENCKEEFESPIEKEITFEEYYGVDHLFQSSHKTKIMVCPCCGSDGTLEEMKECDYCGEWTREDDLVDTEEMIGGNIGYLCPDCIRDCDLGG